MLESQQLLNRMNEITVNWEIYLRVMGPTLGADAIEIGLAGLERLPSLLMRYLWCLDDSVASELHDLLLRKILVLAYQRNWECKNSLSQLMRLVQLAIYEMRNLSTCYACKGAGRRKFQRCYICDGLGVRAKRDAEYAKYSDLSQISWKRLWASKYKEVLIKMVEWNEEGIEHLMLQL